MSRKSYEMQASPSTRDMSEAKKIPQMTHPEAYTHQIPYYSPPSTSPSNLETSSSTTTILRMVTDHRMTHLIQRYEPYPNQNRMKTVETNVGRKKMISTPSPGVSTKQKLHLNGTNFGQDRFRQRQTRTKVTNPNNSGHFPPNLTPSPSPLHPACPVKDRLRLWKPASSNGQNDENPTFLLADEERIKEVLAEAYSDATKATYGTGLLVFHVFCDKKEIEDSKRTPCRQTLLSGFISTLIGDYSAQAIENYTYGLRAWHIIHRIPWNIDSAELKALFASAAKNQPPKSKKAQRPPCTIEDLVAIREDLNLNNPFDTAVFTCLTTTFWAVARLGEFTIPNLHAFDLEIHVKRSNLNTNVTDRHGNEVTTIFVPWTKTSKSQGKILNWAKQPHTGVDPEKAMQNHLKINNFNDDLHLFHHHWRGTSRPMSKNIFLTRIRKALINAKSGSPYRNSTTFTEFSCKRVK